MPSASPGSSEALLAASGRSSTCSNAAVFAQASSPYARLLAHAGIEHGDIARLVADDGVDRTLERLYDAGVHVSVDEFRGHKAVERGGLSFAVRDTDFDNPLAAATWSASTGGSRSAGRKVLINAAHFEQSAVYYTLFLLAHEAGARPEAIWRPWPTRTAVNNALRSARQRRPLEKWFSQTAVGQRPFRAQDALLAGYALLAARIWATPVPRPEHVPFSEAIRVARWLEEQSRRGTPALLSATVGSAARVCSAALEHGADISGTLFRAGGEPLTPARAALVDETGSTIVADYSMAELGRAGVSCAAPTAVGDVHLLADKVAIVQRPRVVETTGETVGALHFTTLLPSSPKLMINVETDDYAVVEDRACGCLIGELGLRAASPRHPQLREAHERGRHGTRPGRARAPRDRAPRTLRRLCRPTISSSRRSTRRFRRSPSSSVRAWVRSTSARSSRSCSRPSHKVARSPRRSRRSGGARGRYASYAASPTRRPRRRCCRSTSRPRGAASSSGLSSPSSTSCSYRLDHSSSWAM